MIPRTTLLSVLVALLAACGTPQPKSQPQRGSTNADSLAAAAVRAWSASGGRERALTLIQQAAEREPRRADLAWLHLRLCTETKGCEPEPLETRLRKLDPGNGIVWLGALERAQARRDTGAADQILEAMSRAERFDVYWTTLVSRVSPALRAEANASTQTPLTDALNDAANWVSTSAVPPLNPLGTACEQQRVREPATLTRCLRIAQALQRSDTTLIEGFGLGLGQRLATPGSAAAVALDERAATLSYQNQTAGSIVQGQVERDKFSAQMIELMKKLRREQDVSNAILRWAGQPTTPQ